MEQIKYTLKINSHFTGDRDTPHLWQGIQDISDYKAPPQGL